jgi:cysteine desulfurase / selenocysteine lyase
MIAANAIMTSMRSTMANIDTDIAGEFPGIVGGPYLDTAARGLLPRSAHAAITASLESVLMGRAEKDGMFATVERTRERFAKLINARAGEIAITKNISEGLNIIAAALPWRAGDNVVVCRELEHPNNIFPWAGLKRRLGIEIREVPARAGQLLAEDVIAAVDDRTRIVTLCEVSFSPGLRVDLAPIGKFTRARDIFFLVDGAQTAGIVHTDVEASGIDGFAVSTQKGLLGIYGMGLLYCRQGWAERLNPVYLARFGVDLGATHEAARGGDDFRLMPDARRFDVGNYNFAAAAGAEVSLALLDRIGTRTVEAHVTRLARRLASGLEQLGLPVAGTGENLASIVSIGRHGAGGHDSSDDPQTQKFAEALKRSGVRLSVRQGMVRLSFHIYNNDDDVDHVLEVARGLQ